MWPRRWRCWRPFGVWVRGVLGWERGHGGRESEAGAGQNARGVLHRSLGRSLQRGSWLRGGWLDHTLRMYSCSWWILPNRGCHINRHLSRSRSNWRKWLRCCSLTRSRMSGRKELYILVSIIKRATWLWRRKSACSTPGSCKNVSWSVMV